MFKKFLILHPYFQKLVDVDLEVNVDVAISYDQVTIKTVFTKFVFDINLRLPQRNP